MQCVALACRLPRQAGKEENSGPLRLRLAMFSLVFLYFNQKQSLKLLHTVSLIA